MRLAKRELEPNGFYDVPSSRIELCVFFTAESWFMELNETVNQQ